MHVSRRGLVAAAALAAAGCARDDDDTIRFWAMGREGETAPALLAGFERENPGLRVRVEKVPWTAAHEKLLTAFAGDATPDVAQMGNTWLPEMAAIGAIEPLAPFLAATPQVDATDYYAGIWATNSVGAVRVGVPWYVDTRLLYVRRDLLARAGFSSVPADWDGWLRSLAALKSALQMPTPLLLPTNEFEPLLAFALQQPDALLRGGGRLGNFRSAGFRRALAFYLQLFQRGFAPGITNNQVANLWQEFGRGSFAYYISGPWNIGEFRRRLPAGLQGAWTTAPLPGPDGPGVSIAGGSSLVLFRRSRVKPLAWKLIEYLSRPAVQQQFYGLTGNLPPRRSAFAGALAADPAALAFAQQLERVRPAPAVPEWERIMQEMQLAAAQAIAGRADIDTTVRTLDARVDAMLEKRRWMLDRTT